MSNKTILIIVHEDNIRRCLAEVLSEEGYTVFTESSGLKGLELILKEEYPLVIINQDMPKIEMDGIEVLREIKKIKPETQVIMIAGHGSIESSVMATKMGAFDYIQKPLSLERLLITVKRSLGATKSEQF